MLKMRFIFSLAVSVFTLAAMAQENVSNIRVQQEDHILMIMYDLVERADIEVYASFDGGVTYTGPLQYVTGAVGQRVAPGVDKMIAWNVYSEFGEIDYPNTVIKVVSAGLFSGGKEITFFYRGRATRYEDTQIRLMLDGETIVTARRSEGFRISINDPNPGVRNVVIYSSCESCRGNRVYLMRTHKINTSRKSSFEFRRHNLGIR